MASPAVTSAAAEAAPPPRAAAAGTEVNVGVLPALAPGADQAALRRLVATLLADVRPVLEAGSGARWRFHADDPEQLVTDETRRPADFLGEASRRLAQGSLDLVVVVTDVPLVSARETVVAGLASPITRVCVLSVYRLRTSNCRRLRPIGSPEVRWNAAALLMHLIGHCLGFDHRAGAAMAPFAFDEGRRDVPPFAASDRLRRRVARFPEREYRVRGRLHDLAIHLALALRHPIPILAALWRNRAPLLPLKMPGLATAAVAPTFLLVFTAEFWDAGLSMSNGTAWTYALISVLGATLYLALVQDLFLPRKEHRVVTAHLAIANAVILSTMLLAMIGLFFMVALLMLAIEVFVFPAGLISTWPTLDRPAVTFEDKFRLAVFISTIGVTTGALAGGLERQNVMRGMALFHADV